MGKIKLISERDQLVMQAINRYVWPRWTGKKDALARAAYYCTEGHRRRRYYKCEKCGKDKLLDTEREVDHIVCRIPLTGYDDLMSWIERTLCSAENLQILCEQCHKEKSAKEAAERAENRRKNLKSRRKGKKTRRKR